MNNSLHAQFLHLKSRSPPQLSCLDPYFRNLNRFGNVIPTPEFLVTLQHPPEYINASILCNGSYIATQAPLRNSFASFWQMIFEKKCPLVCALTPLSVMDTYYPTEVGSTLSFGFFNVTLNFEQIFQDCKTVCRSFTVSPSYSTSCSEAQPSSPCTPGVLTLCNSYSSNVHHCIHLQYLDWPDGGIPTSFQSCCSFLSLISDHCGGFQ
ncbi:hypothetical protein GEMRC1_002521 [Eukaryota sp. GEM-RC1]